MRSDIYGQDECLVMGSPLPPAKANINIEYLEKLCQNQYDVQYYNQHHLNQSCDRCIDYTFKLWLFWEDTQLLLDHGDLMILAFLNVLIHRRGPGFKKSVYIKPAFSGQEPNFDSHHPYSLKKMIVRCGDPEIYQQEMAIINITLQCNRNPV